MVLGAWLAPILGPTMKRIYWRRVASCRYILRLFSEPWTEVVNRSSKSSSCSRSTLEKASSRAETDGDFEVATRGVGVTNVVIAEPFSTMSVAGWLFSNLLVVRALSLETDPTAIERLANATLPCVYVGAVNTWSVGASIEAPDVAPTDAETLIELTGGSAIPCGLVLPAANAKEIKVD